MVFLSQSKRLPYFSDSFQKLFQAHAKFTTKFTQWRINGTNTKNTDTGVNFYIIRNRIDFCVRCWLDRNKFMMKYRWLDTDATADIEVELTSILMPPNRYLFLCRVECQLDPVFIIKYCEATSIQLSTWKSSQQVCLYRLITTNFCVELNADMMKIMKTGHRCNFRHLSRVDNCRIVV